MPIRVAKNHLLPYIWCVVRHDDVILRTPQPPPDPRATHRVGRLRAVHVVYNIKLGTVPKTILHIVVLMI